MEMMITTAVQKLGRLKQIQNLMLTGRQADYPTYLAEQRAILQSVGLPPLELIGNPWGLDWAAAFGEAFPGFDAETLQTWFQNACAAGAKKGYEEAQMADKAGLVQAVETVLAGVRAGRIKQSGGLVVDGEELTLEQYLERALSEALQGQPAPAVATVSHLPAVPASDIDPDSLGI